MQAADMLKAYARANEIDTNYASMQAALVVNARLSGRLSGGRHEHERLHMKLDGAQSPTTRRQRFIARTHLDELRQEWNAPR